MTPRTVRRDVERLRDLGYPVNATPGTGGGYQLGAGAELPPLLLDDDEAVAVAVGLRTAAGNGVDGIVGPADGTLEPLDAGSCLLRTGAVNLDVLVIHVMLLGCEFEVIEPPELTRRIRAAKDLLGRAVDRSGEQI